MERQAALQSRELDPSSLMGLDDTDSEDDFHLLARMKARQNQEQKDRGEGCGLWGRGGGDIGYAICDRMHKGPCSVALCKLS